MSQLAVPYYVPAREPLVRSVLFPADLIQQRVAALGDQITSDYRNEELILVGILKGGFPFACDLARQVDLPVRLDFMSISRYKRCPGSREVAITHDCEVDLAGRHLLLVEDLVDTGLTLHYLIGILAERNPTSISICALLDRPALRLADIPVRYVGFDVNEEFLVGYGLDYRDEFRELPYIAVMEF